MNNFIFFFNLKYFSVRCGFADFECDNGNCIKWNLQCDVIDDCGDGSDENDSFCRKYSAPSGRFRQCWTIDFVDLDLDKIRRMVNVYMTSYFN